MSGLEIVEIDPFDDEAVRAYWAAGDEADRYERPYSIFWPFKTAVGALRGDDPTWTIVPLAAVKDGEVVGQCQMVLPQLDNRHVAFAGPLVRPAHRRRGIGSALLGAAVERARTEGRTTLIADATRPPGADSSEGWDFLRRRGFEPGITDVHRVMPIPVAAEQLDAWSSTAEPYHVDYRLVSVQGAVPDELVDGFCTLQAAFNSEAPMGELAMEPEVWNEERLRANEQRRERQGTWTDTTFAIAPDGTAAGMTELEVTGDGLGNCLQGGTLVLPEHRGHRLGMALKVANLRLLQSRGEALSTTMIHSWNAEVNDQMGAINAALGFAAVEIVEEMQLAL